MIKITKNLVVLATISTFSSNLFGICANDIDGGGKIFSNFKIKVVQISGDITLDDTYNGRTVEYNSSNNITISLPANISTGYNVKIIKKGDGDITIAKNGNNLSSRIREDGDHNITTSNGSAIVYGLTNLAIINGDIK